MISFRSMFFAWVFALFSFFSVSSAWALTPPGTVSDKRAWWQAYATGDCDSSSDNCTFQAALAAEAALRNVSSVVDDVTWLSVGAATCSDPAVMCSVSVQGDYLHVPSQTRAPVSTTVYGVGDTAPSSIPCPLPGVTAWNTNDSEAVETNAGQSVGTICDGTGCGIEPMGTEMVLPSGGGKEMHFIQWARYTGDRPSTCNSTWLPPSGDVTDYTPAADTPDGVPNSQEDCPAGSAFGQVNGVNVCAPAGSKINYVPESGTSSGGGSSETTRTDTVNEDGSVTTTTTNVNNGGTTTTTNVTNNYGGASFGAGGAGSDPTSINLGPAPPAESGDVTVDLPGPGSGVDGAGTAQRDFTVSGHFSGAGGCIADRTISAMGVDVVIPLSELCPWFDVVSKILTIVSVFLAMRILVMS